MSLKSRFDACCRQAEEYLSNYLVNKNVPMGLIIFFYSGSQKNVEIVYVAVIAIIFIVICCNSSEFYVAKSGLINNYQTRLQ